MRRTVVVEMRSGVQRHGVVDGDEWQTKAAHINSPVDAVDFLEDAVNEAADMGAVWVKMPYSIDGKDVVYWLMVKDLKRDGVRYTDSDGNDAIYYPVKRLLPAKEKWEQLEFNF